MSSEGQIHKRAINSHQSSVSITHLTFCLVNICLYCLIHKWTKIYFSEKNPVPMLKKPTLFHDSWTFPVEFQCFLKKVHDFKENLCLLFWNPSKRISQKWSLFDDRTSRNWESCLSPMQMKRKSENKMKKTLTSASVPKTSPLMLIDSSSSSSSGSHRHQHWRGRGQYLYPAVVERGPSTAPTCHTEVMIKYLRC